MVSMNGFPQASSPQAMWQKIRELERKLELLANAKNLRNASVDGPMTVTGNGSLNIEGDFSVPPGSISNESLEAPVEDGSASAAVSNVAITPSSTNTVLATLTVPEGFTKALIVVQGAANVANASTTADKVTATCWIDATSGQPLYAQVPPGESAALTTTVQREVTGLLGGQVIICTMELHTDLVDFPEDPGTTASVNAFAIFRR